MSSSKTIYPMAFKLNGEMSCKLYFVGFPKVWKEKLINIEKIIKSKEWNETKALPTNTLKNSLDAWMDGVIELAPLRANSNDKKWAVSCEQEINTNLLFEHIKIWLSSCYLNNKK